MIIISQDEEMIINFDNICHLQIVKNHMESVNEEDFVYSIFTDGLTNLGNYKSKERAKEVLGDIINAIINYNAFYMPKE